jgi:pyruvate dehydrogenase E2 component (dihydrolipoamide acetyltransferase)
VSVTPVILPKLGLTMEEGRLVAWRKREGERVAKGDVLFEVETDKATMEVEAPASGVVRRLLVREGDYAPVARVIAFIADSADEPLPDAATVDGDGRLEAQTPAAPAPPAVERPQDGERIRVSPAAKKRAGELGVDVASVRGTGPGGRIQIEDVEAAARSTRGAGREPLSRMRRAVAEAMSRSQREVPQFSISRDVDMTAADARRREAGASYTDVIVAACATALREHARFRSRFDGAATLTSDRVDVGVAVALEAGLIVPVIRDADRKDLATLRREREALEEGARAGKLPADALGGASFTVSNLGPFGVDGFTALVNPPEAAILAVGRVGERVVPRDGSPAVRRMATLTLSVDHRVADGADAARFLEAIVRELQS